MGEQLLQVFLEPLRQDCALFPAQLDQPLLSGVGLPVQRKENIEIALQKRRRAVVDAHHIAPLCRLGDLSLVGGQGAPQQPPVPFDNALPQQGRVGHVEPRLHRRQASVPVVEDLAGEQIVPHAGGVPVPALAVLHHGGHVLDEIVQIAVKNVNINAVLQRAVVLVLPEVVADLHVPAVPAQKFPPDLLRHRGGAVEVDVVVGRFVVHLPRPGPAQGDGLHLGEGGQRPEQRFDREVLLIFSHALLLTYQGTTVNVFHLAHHFSHFFR